MSVRVAALVVAALYAVACTPSADDTPPPSAQVATIVSSAPPAGDTVPADRWRVVLVAGDNSSPAFDNGVQSLREKLTAHGVQNIRALSANPARTASAELASSSNVFNALRSGGGGACLAFLTSHGNEQGFFLRPDRRLFDPVSLDKALTSGCGSAPTVVVVSACHSGAFLTRDMRRPNRVILTAAAIDRTSFGCGASDVYTYYDKCFLQQFDTATTWRELALATRSCVEDLERRLGVRQTSQPQLFVGAAVPELRLPGR